MLVKDIQIYRRRMYKQILCLLDDNQIILNNFENDSSVAKLLREIQLGQYVWSNFPTTSGKYKFLN